MATEMDVEVSRSVASELYPLAVKQARAQVVIQLLVLAAFAIVLIAAGFPRRWLFALSMLTVGVVATAYDIRWWLWLRRADPVEAHRRLQERSEFEGGDFRRLLTVAITAGAFLAWLTLSRN